jgi:hypothetical protein
MSQQARKEQEGVVVRRLTVGAGAAALGLAWYFTASATSAAPIAFGAQSATDDQPVVGIEQLDDHVFVRTVHVPAVRPPAGGVRSGSTAAASGQTAATAKVTGGATPTGATQTTAQAATGSAPVAQPVAQPVPAATPAPTPAPVATTSASTPAK